MRILVLGATGFVGRNCMEYFAAKGHEVIAHYHLRGVTLEHATRFVKADLHDEDAVKRMMEGVDVVIQAAAATSGCKDTLQDPALHIRSNAVMNSYIFPAAVKAGVKHVIFPSCSVMYQSSDAPLRESDFDAQTPLNPAYLGFASTKLYCEKLCEFYAGISDTKFTVMRNTNFYGPYDKYDLNRSHVFGATITKVMTAGRPIVPTSEMSAYEVSQRQKEADTVTVWGTGEEARDFLHVENFCRFAELAIEKQSAKYELYNVGSGQAVKIRDLVAKVVDLSGKKLAIEYDTSKPTIPTSLCLDTTKAREELGWEPEVTLEYGITSTLAWWKDNVVL